jgi:hypothetical protein
VRTQYALLRNAVLHEGTGVGDHLSMAIQFARARYISRSSGGNAVRSAAYNGRDAIAAERTGELFYFRHRDAPAHHEVLLPEGAAEQFRRSGVLWNAAEMAEKRKDAQVAREIVVALPADAEIIRSPATNSAPSNAILLPRGFAALALRVGARAASHPPVRELSHRHGGETGRAAACPPAPAAPPVHPHLLRHSCGFYLANRGYDLRLIQDYLGTPRSETHRPLHPGRRRPFRRALAMIRADLAPACQFGGW